VSDDLRGRLEAMTTDELLGILQKRDAGEWRDEVFPIVEELLHKRGVQPPQAPVPQDAELEPSSLISVATYSTALEANLCRMALIESGIEAWLTTEHLAGVAPHLALALGVDVLVRDEDAAGAREVLQELAAGGAALAIDPEVCPRCGSVETDHVQQPNRSGAVAGFALVGMPLPAVRWRWVCRRCRHEWP